MSREAFEAKWTNFSYVDMRQCAEVFWQAATEQSAKELQELRALVAMKDEALRNIMDDQHMEENRYVFLTAKRALSISPESLAAWEASKLEPLQREVEKERNIKLGVMQQRDDERQAYLNEFSKTQELQKQVAMLLHVGEHGDAREWLEATRNTQATAEAFFAERDAKVLEEAAVICDAMYKKEDMDSQNQTENYRTGYSDGSGDCGNILRYEAAQLRENKKL